eukprot:4713336-Pleurochrysis_carterae.AAC.1
MDKMQRPCRAATLSKQTQQESTNRFGTTCGGISFHGCTRLRLLAMLKVRSCLIGRLPLPRARRVQSICSRANHSDVEVIHKVIKWRAAQLRRLGGRHSDPLRLSSCNKIGLTCSKADDVTQASPRPCSA